MGNRSSNPGVLHEEARLAANKFDQDEITLLQKTWQELADRTNGKGIDKETFLQYFPLNGLLGERLFVQFDTKDNGLIDFDEFVTGLAIMCRGTLDDKIHFLFNMYDVSHDNTVSKQELSTLLNHVPKNVLQSTMTYNSNYGGGNGNETDSSCATEENSYHDPDFDEIDNYTNHDMVEKAFMECDLNHEGRLSYEEFKMWVQKTPSLLDYLDNIMPYHGPKGLEVHHDKRETLPQTNLHGMKRASSRHQLHKDSLSADSPRGQLLTRKYSLGASSNSNTPPSSTLSRSGTGSHPPVLASGDGEEKCRSLLAQAMEATQNESLRLNISALLESFGGIDGDMQLEISEPSPSIEGFLWKQGKGFLHAWTKRYYLLSGQCIYYYSHQEDTRPKGVIFLTGSLIERIKDKDNELKGFYGFEVVHQDLCTGEHHRHDQRLLYCKSEDERDRWVTLLQKAAHVVPIEDDYVIGKELGRGRFSVVKECVHKRTNVHAAVKIIDKATMEPEEKVLLRTEIAVLKLVNHPNIICMKGLYESKQHIFIVMEMLKGGELFERIVGRPRFTEPEAAKIIRPLLESVAYLHDLGIVHRDLKPENILCGSELEDLKIADFGLSKMILPKEKMDAACGTLSYVAPEVLTMQGYGKEADLWSVGVIMFLLLCGKLPFDGDDHNEIIRSTIAAEIKVSQVVWGKLSEEAKSLMQSLLNKSPKERITARDALRHPFILNYNPPHGRRHSATISSHREGGIDADGNPVPSASPPTTPTSSTPTSSPCETPTTNAIPSSTL